MVWLSQHSALTLSTLTLCVRCPRQAGMANAALSTMLLLTILLAVLHQYLLQIQQAGVA